MWYRITRWRIRLLAVRPEGANHPSKETPPGELGIPLEADKRLDRVTGWAEPLSGALLPRGLLWISTRQIGARCGGWLAWQRCWRYARGLDLDLQSFFDQIVSKLLMRAVREHQDCPWVLLYIKRRLQAPVQNGGWEPRKGERNATGWVVSPIFVELSFFIYTFDIWMQRVTLRPSRLSVMPMM